MLIKSARKFSSLKTKSNYTKPPLKVSITGANGNIGYAFAFWAAKGDLFGKEQPIILSLIDLKNSLGSLEGLLMELKDCAFPLLEDI